MSGTGRLPPHLARRRAVALAGHQGDPTVARSALQDVDPSVRATALGALARLGALTRADVEAAAADPDPRVRGRAATLAPSSLEGTDANVVLRRLLADADATVVEVAAW